MDNFVQKTNLRQLSNFDGIKVARNEVKNASFAQRSAHHDSRMWRPESIWTGRRAQATRARTTTDVQIGLPDPQILPQCNISSNYPL